MLVIGLDLFECRTIGDQEPVILRADHPFLPPPAHDPDRGFLCGSDHIGDLLAAEDNWNSEEVPLAAPDPIGHCQEESSDAVLDMAGSLGQLASQLNHPAGQAEKQAPRQQRIGGEQGEQFPTRHGEQARALQRNRGAGEIGLLIGRDRADRIARAEYLQDDIATADCRLDDLDPAAQDEMEHEARLPFPENRRALLIGPDADEGPETLPLGRLEALEQRYGGPGDRRFSTSRRQVGTSAKLSPMGDGNTPMIQIIPW